MGTPTPEMDPMPLLRWAQARDLGALGTNQPPLDITGIMNSAGATVHDEPCPLLRLVAIGPDPVIFVTNF
jgi:hypothetical protein